MTVHSKVTASTLASAVGSYVVTLLADNFGVHVSADLQALLVAAVTSVAVFVAGYLKREHLISDATYAEFVPASAEVDGTAKKVDLPDAAPQKIDLPVIGVSRCDDCPAKHCAGCPEES